MLNVTHQNRGFLPNMLKTLINSLFRVCAHDATNLTPNTLIISNHNTFLNALILALNFPSIVFIVDNKTLSNPFFRFALSFVEYLTIDDKKPLTIRRVLQTISQKPTAIFLKGKLADGDALMKIYGAAAFIVAKTNAKIVPIRLEGPGFSYFVKLSLPKMFFPKIHLRVLKDAFIGTPSGVGSRKARMVCATKLKEIMQDALLEAHKMDYLFNLFLESTALYGDKNFIEDHNQIEASYSKLLKIANAAGIALNRHTKEGEALGLMLPNVIATLGVILGATKEGRIPAMLNYTSGMKSIRACAESVNMKSVITSRAFLEKAGLSLDDLGLNIIYVEDLKGGLTLFDKIKVFLQTKFPQKVRDKPEELVMLFTSGSEGAPKAVVHTHRSIISNAAQLRAVSDFGEDDKFFLALPIFHSFGFTCGCVLPILSGSKIFLYPNPLHYKIIPSIIREKSCTILFGTSTFLQNYAKSADEKDFATIRYVVAGAEKLSSQTRELWSEKFDIDIMEGYGATETAPVISVNTPLSSAVGSVGKLLPGMSYMLEDVDGMEGKILHVQGPNVMKGYIKADNPGVIAHCESIFGKGWYSTGDIVEIEDGYIFIKGRLRRFVKIAGEMISLEAVENFVKSVSDLSHAVISVPSENRGESLLLFTTDGSLTTEALLSKAKEIGYPEMAIPKKRIVVDAIPSLGTGKVDYVTLKESYTA